MTASIPVFSILFATSCGGLERCVDIYLPASKALSFAFGFVVGLFVIRFVRWVLDILP